MDFKKLLFGIAVMALGMGAGPVSAQGIKLGLEAGGSMAAFIGSDADEEDYISRLGFIGGAFLQVELGPNFALALEALYSQKGAEVDYGGGDKVTLDLSYVDVPLLVKYYLPTPGIRPNFFVGGSVGFNTLAQAVDGDGDVAELADPQSTEFGLIAGVGVDFDKFMVNLRYQMGLSEFQEGVDLKNGVLSLMVGYSFI